MKKLFLIASVSLFPYAAFANSTIPPPVSESEHLNQLNITALTSSQLEDLLYTVNLGFEDNNSLYQLECINDEVCLATSFNNEGVMIDKIYFTAFTENFSNKTYIVVQKILADGTAFDPLFFEVIEEKNRQKREGNNRQNTSRKIGIATATGMIYGEIGDYFKGRIDHYRDQCVEGLRALGRSIERSQTNSHMSEISGGAHIADKSPNKGGGGTMNAK